MKNIILLIALLALTVSSCIKAPKVDPNLPELEFKIPDNFDWKTTKDIKITVNVTAVDAQSKDKLHTIKIYNSPLLNSGALISSGTATANKPYSIAISVASITDKLYIYEMKPNGLVTVTNQEILAPSINVKLANEPVDAFTKSNAFVVNNLAPPVLPAMPFPTNYDVSIIDNSAITLLGFGAEESSAYGNTYKSFYIPAGITVTSGINFSNHKAHYVLYVKGHLTIAGNVTMNKGSIVILNGGTVSFDNFSNSVSIPLPFIYVENGGTLNINNNLILNNGASVVNKGNISIAKDISTNGAGTIINQGPLSFAHVNSKLFLTNNFVLYNSSSINVSDIELSVGTTMTNEAGVITTKKIYFTNNSVINNHGEIVSTVKFSNSGGGTVNNFCRITTNETYAQALTANLKEGSLWSSQTFKVNNSTFNMDGGSMFSTANIPIVYGMKFISTSPTFALIKNTGDMEDLRWAASQIKGNIEFVHDKLVAGTVANGIDLFTPAFDFGSGAILSKVQTKNIVGTGCNLSLGQITPIIPPPGPDTENITYFPSQSGWGTYAFEDLWPFKGDYDLNDMVLKFRVSIVSNGSNKVTKLIFDYTLIAVGATKTPSVAFQLDNVTAANIGSVTGQILGGGVPFSVAANGTEPGANLAIIPVFNNPKDVVSFPVFLNTEKNRAHIIAPTNQIVVTLSTPVDQSQITMDSFNLFISTDERGKEIHLPTFAATSKFKASLAMNKPLNANDIFKYIDGMMWGLMFPDNFAYPKENASIINAYTHFAAWATSGGTSYLNWYSNEAGYRNEDLIY